MPKKKRIDEEDDSDIRKSRVILSILLVIILILFTYNVTTEVIDYLDEEEEEEIITMAQFYSQVNKTPIKNGEHLVDFLDYEPGDTVIIKDIITKIFMHDHSMTVFSYMSLGNRSYITWPRIDGVLNTVFKIGDPITIVLHIVEDSYPFNGVTGEWYWTVREGSISTASVELANWKEKDIPIDYEFVPFLMTYNVYYHVNITNSTLIQFNISVDDQPFDNFDLTFNEINPKSRFGSYGIDRSTIGFHNVSFKTTIDGKLLYSGSFDVDIIPDMENSFDFEIYENRMDFSFTHRDYQTYNDGW